MIASMMLFTFSCAQSEAINTASVDAIVSADSVTSPDAGCQGLSTSELERLRQLQTEIPYTVYAPTCLPAGFRLDPSSVGKSAPIPAGSASGNRPEYETKPRYYYNIANGAALLKFGGNSVGDPSIAKLNFREVRSHQALVYSASKIDESGKLTTVPFESSSFYRVLWSDERDFTDAGDRMGANYVYGDNIGWNELLKIVNSLKPVDELEMTKPDSGSTDAKNIRTENWTEVVGAGPRPYDDHIEAVHYSDFTGDGTEDALVLDRLGGTGRFLRLYVYSYVDGKLTKLFEAIDVPKGEARLGQTADSFVTEYAIADGDEPNCCPRHLGIRTLTWSQAENKFIVTSEEVVPNPAARN